MAKETIKLTKENFFGMINKEAPLAYQVFLSEIDKFKTKINWDSLFAADGVNEDGSLKRVKFHDIPYAFQRGFITLFFAGMDILVYVNPSDTKKKGYSWLVVDTIQNTMAKSFLDAGQQTETVFASFLQCEIDALKSAFVLLHERLDTSKPGEIPPSLN